MSNALVCLNEPLSFHAQDLNMNEISYKNSSFSGVHLQSATEGASNYDRMGSENQKPSCAFNSSLQKPVPASRKREASNALMECVKRRDLERDGDLKLNVPFQLQSTVTAPLRTAENDLTCDVKAESEGESSMDTSHSELVDATDSGFETLSKNSSPCHSTDTLSSQEDEVYRSTLVSMDISESGKCSAAIYEDLDCLHLTDEAVLLQSTRSPISESLFSNVASTIYFSLKEERVAPLPDHVVPFLKWKLSTITPVLIKEIVQKCGFSLLDANTTEEWLGTWGKHLKCASFKKIKNYQKVNHYPGSFHLGRKDKLWDNYKRMQARCGTDVYNFFPETFHLPNDTNLLKSAWEADGEQCWIIKPPASARGTGVKVVYKWAQVPKNRPMIVQRYLSNPYLINGTKFDLRIYVLVTSIEPLRIYVFEDGLVRFASEKYSLSNKSLSNRFVHLTNYSINRKSSSYTANEDENSCQGHKWTLKTFWSYMVSSGIDVEKIQESITDMIIKTVICAEGPICRLMKIYAKSTYNCFELFGFDIMLDQDLRPWLLEVNISPSLHTRSMLDSIVKGQMVKDMLNMAGFQVPEKKAPSSTGNSPPTPYGVLSSVANKHKALRNRCLSLAEKEKHSEYTFKYEKFDILMALTPDDVRCLIESEDEFHRKGSFVRVFPTATSSRYFKYFEHIRYYNLLLDAWEKSHADRRDAGIQHLRDLCDKKVHLQGPLKEVSPPVEEPSIEITVH